MVVKDVDSFREYGLPAQIGGKKEKHKQMLLV